MKVTFRDGASIVVDREHLWTIETHAARVAAVRVSSSLDATTEIGPATVTTGELAELVEAERRPVTIPVADPIGWRERELPVGPYTLGAWLGDGDAAHARLTAHVDDAGHLASRIVAEEGDSCEVRITTYGDRPHIAAVRINRRHDICRRGHQDLDAHGHCRTCINDLGAGRGRSTWTHFGLLERLRDLGVLGCKRIPESYLTASPGQRLSLLQGLMDTDGTVHHQRSGRCVIGLSNPDLAGDVHRLAMSLGLKASRTVKRTSHRDSHLVSFSTDAPVATLPRKAELLPKANPRMDKRYVASVEPIDSRPVACIAVNRPDGLFCAGHETIVTHNSVFVDQMADSAADQGRKVHLYLTEMTAYQRGLRLLARKAHVPFSKLKRRELDQHHWIRIKEALLDLPYGVSIVSDWTVEDVVAHVRENKWDLAVVDLIHGFHYQDERDLSRTSSALMRAAKSSATDDHPGTVVVCVAHLNDGQMRDQRSAVRPRPGLHSIKGSSSLKQDADTVLFVWREDNPDGTPTSDGAVWIAKCRNGDLGGLNVRLDSARMQFVEGNTWGADDQESTAVSVSGLGSI